MQEKNLFQNVLASFRARMGDAWTQGKTASELGVSRTTYNAWETGKSLPTQLQLKRIAAAFYLKTEEEDILYRAAAREAPDIYNPPFAPNPFFTGRIAYLEQLRQLLQENNSVSVTQPVSISGLGGIGKTQLALEYAHRCYHDKVYRAVLWVDASEKAMIEASYTVLAELIGLPEIQLHDTERIVQAVKQWLQTHTHWLLIMDNVDDLYVARSFLPVTHQGHVLLTTRSQIVGNIARQIELTEMDPTEALLFVLLRSHSIQGEVELDVIAPDVRNTAQQLADLLGKYPLALDQAAAYIEETHISFVEYMRLFREYRNSLMHRQEPRSEHPENVVATIEMSIKRAAKLHPLAMDILRFCAFWYSDAIHESFFQYEDSFVLEPLAFNDAITALLRHSLIRRNVQQQWVYWHPLVRSVVVDSMSSEEIVDWKGRARRAMLHNSWAKMFDDLGLL